MALSDRKITDSQISTNGVVSAPDELKGTIPENKAIFDKLIKEAVKVQLNGLIDDLIATTGAAQIGASAPARLTGANIQALINALNIKKVDKVDGKQLSTNDYDNTEKEAVAGKANAVDVLTKTNTTVYAPTADYHPATKKYIDQKIFDVGAVASVCGVSPGMGGDVPVTLKDVGGSNHNLLTNPWFTVNQRAVPGLFSTAGSYFVDCWKLVSGSVTVNADKTLTLNGTIQQTLENGIEGPFTASALCISGVASASYDNTTKVFTITSSGGNVKMAKLEPGNISTAANDQPANYGEQLKLCQRYYLPIANYARQRATLVISNIIHFSIPTPVTMRATPTITGTPVVQKLDNAPQTGFVFSVGTRAENCITIIATKDAHGLTDATLNPNDIAFSAEL